MEGMNITVKCGFESKSQFYCLFDPEKSLAVPFSLFESGDENLLCFSLHFEGVKIKSDHDVTCFVNCKTTHTGSFLFFPNISYPLVC